MKSLLLNAAIACITVLSLGIFTPNFLNTGISIPDWEVECDQPWSRYGDGISSGDVNGDGYDDVAVGAPAYETNGAVFLYYGSAAGPSLTPDKVIFGNGVGYGNRVSCNGDVNNDGYSDLIVGDPFTGHGKVHAYYGSPSGPSDSADWVWTPPDSIGGLNFGYRVSSAGDVNGDGFDDLLASFGNYIDSNFIGALVFLGSASGLPDSGPSWTASRPDHLVDFYPNSMSLTGDVNGDGFDDVALSYAEEKRIYLYYGSPGRQMYDPPDRIISHNTYDFGYSSGIVKDVNADGYDELIAGDREDGYSSVYVYFGSPSGPSVNPQWTHPGSPNCFAYNVSTAGDFNSDGFNDILVSECDSPGVMVFFGFAGGIKDSPHTLHAPCYNLASGDINGDGISDAVSSSEPRAYGFFGSRDRVSSLIITPHTSTYMLFETSICTVSVKDQFDLPAVGEVVKLKRYGATVEVEIMDSSLTDSNGTVIYSYLNILQRVGFDTIIAHCRGLTDTAIVLWDLPLPVELSSLRSQVINKNDLILSWSTISELNNSGFEIERKSKTKYGLLENAKWRRLGFVAGSGTSNEVKQYSFTDKNLESGKYMYRLKQIDVNGNFEFFELSEEVTIGIPDKFYLEQNYPNPFNPVTTIAYGIRLAGNVKLKVFDMSGREVMTLINEFKDEGYYTVKLDASGIASGAYAYRIESGNFVSVKKMVLLK